MVAIYSFKQICNEHLLCADIWDNINMTPKICQIPRGFANMQMFCVSFLFSSLCLDGHVLLSPVGCGQVDGVIECTWYYWILKKDIDRSLIFHPLPSTNNNKNISMCAPRLSDSTKCFADPFLAFCPYQEREGDMSIAWKWSFTGYLVSCLSSLRFPSQLIINGWSIYTAQQMRE